MYQRLSEILAAFLTMGLGAVPEESNGEVIRVTDTRTGHVCLEFASPGVLLGLAGKNHADISPNGRLLVVSTLSDVSVYDLPAICR